MIILTEMGILVGQTTFGWVKILSFFCKRKDDGPNKYCERTRFKFAERLLNNTICFFFLSYKNQRVDLLNSMIFF